MQKECRRAAWRGRGTKPSTTQVTSSHTAKTARWDTRTKSQPLEKTSLRSHEPSESACPIETQREDAIRLRPPFPPARTTLETRALPLEPAEPQSSSTEGASACES